jgi:hypothetical protein
MKKTLLLLILATATSIVFAQTYKDKAGEIQKMVWGDTSPEFALKEVPAKYANESAVILAQSYKMQRTATTKFRYLIITAGVSNRLMKIATIHERVKINDKSSLESYSTLEYQKKMDKSVSFLFSKIQDTHDTYIGAKIIKPNGQEIIVNTGEEVLLKNTGKDQQGKLAISGLQVGDILDYYISTNDLTEKYESESYKTNDQIFMQVSEYPILNYSIEFQLSKKLDIQSIAANGAKQLTEGTATKDDRFFSLKLQDVPKYEGQMWTALYRQYPYIEISNIFSQTYGSFMNRERDKTTSRLEAIKTSFETLFNEQFFRDFDEPGKKLKEYFEGKTGLSPFARLKERRDGNKWTKAVPTDTLMHVLYDIWRFNVFGSYSGSTADDIAQLNYRRANSKINAASMSMLLTDLEIDHEVLLVSSRNTSTISNAFNAEDVDAIIKVVNNNNKPIYLCFYDALTHYNEIPPQFQGEHAVALKPTRKNATKYTFTESNYQLPVTTSDNNQIDEQVNITLPATNMQKLQVTRSVKQTGYMRHDDQKTLLSAMDIDKALMDKVKGDELAKRLNKNPDTKKLADVFLGGMGKSLVETKKGFSDEIKTQFDQEPQNLANYKIFDPAIDSNNPAFQFTSTFTLDNMVKKAGNNYIVDAGKLAGTFLKLEEKDRKRTADIYMPGARSFKYSISINIPKGYHVKGIEEFNKQKNYLCPHYDC